MALITADRVYDTTTTTGTSALSVSGTAPTGYRTFSAVMTTNDTCYYAAVHQTANEWEVGVGTYSSSNTLTRTTILASSNSNSAVNFSAGTKNVYITMPAAKAVQVDASGNVGIGTTLTSNVLSVVGTANLAGSSNQVAAIITNVAEPTLVNATPISGNINFDVTTQSVVYYTGNPTTNWAVNFRGGASTTLNSLMSIGQTLTSALMVTQGVTPYYNNVVTIDGTVITPKWQGGTAPTSGNACW